jgi:ACS family pantothenate transporter-like MFS transporter
MVDQKHPEHVDTEIYTPDPEAHDISRGNVVVKPVQTWKGYIWDTWELPPDQRWLLFKVDAFVLTFASIGYFLKNIDQTNVNNAFLSGMKEDLSMYGNELVTSQHDMPPCHNRRNNAHLSSQAHQSGQSATSLVRFHRTFC